MTSTSPFLSASPSAPSPAPAAVSVLNCSLPEWAMVPRLRSSSSSVMPMPLSLTVMVRASLSKPTSMASVERSTCMLGSVRLLNTSLSMASDALDTSSRRKISLLV